MISSPFLHQAPSVTRVMLMVLAALLPGIAVYVHFFGAAILAQILVASLAALAAEAAVLALRGRPVRPALADGSALVTAWLLALSLPPLAPWWLAAVAALFAIVVAKHLYGGLGQNPFNPAMAGFAAMIVAFPALMGQRPAAGHAPSAGDALQLVFGLVPRVDALSSATSLDSLKTALMQTGATVDAVRAGGAAFGFIGGAGWEWVALAYLLGGVWLLSRGIMTWHVPVAFLAALATVAALFHAYDAARYAPPLFHLASGGAMLGAFFIATDPVSGATTPRGKLIFAACAGALTYFIRVFGAYPDGVAFAVLIMNLAAPLIDLATRPPVFGHKGGGSGGRP